MRFMIIVRASVVSEAQRPEQPDPVRAAAIVAMAEYHQQLAQAGVLLDAARLQPSAEGWRIRHRASERRVTAGPFAETKEMIAGYTVIEVPDRESALEWSRRCPAPFGDAVEAEIEVRLLDEAAAF